MFLALLVFHFYHPGKVLVGPDSEYSKVSKEEKAEMKRVRREEKARRREEEREAKRVGDKKRVESSDVSEAINGQGVEA